MSNPKIKITLDNKKTMVIELYPEIAPLTVSNFLKLVEGNYYEGVCWHRIIDNFMIQGGGYAFSDSEGITPFPEVEPIRGEFKSNGFDNTIKHQTGVISMARTMDKNSASSQFFICNTDCPHLDGEYAAFGKIVDSESVETLLELSKTPIGSVSRSFTHFPCPPRFIDKIEVVKV